MSGVATLGTGAILGTPASGVVTNLTGTASININGTVGATTANTGAFTSGTFSTTLGVTGLATFNSGTQNDPSIRCTGTATDGLLQVFQGRNTSAGTSATTRFALGNNLTVAGATLTQYSSTHSTKPNYFDIQNEFTAPLRLSADGGGTHVTITSTGVTIPGTLGVTGTSTMAAINASGNINVSSSNIVLTAATGAINMAGALTLAPVSANPQIFLTDATKGSAYLQGGVNTGGTGAGDYWIFNVPTSRGLSWAVNNVSVLNVNSTVANLNTSLSQSVAANSDWAATFQNTGSTDANGLYVNLGASATGIPFRVDKNGSALLTVSNAGAVTIPGTLGVGGVTGSSAKVDSRITDGGNPGSSQIGITAKANFWASNDGYLNGSPQIAFGYGATYAPAAIGMVATSQASFTCGDLVFSTRSVTTDTQPTERMRITSTGVVELNGAGANGLLAILGRSGLSTMYVQRSNTAQSFGVEDDGNVYAGQIGASTGTSLILSSGYIKTLTSSRRYKKDEEPIDIGLDFINTLKPIKFRLKENDLPQVGFIAEDFPDERLVDMSYIDIENKELGMRPESVHYSQITAPLVKAVQELSAKVAALEAAR